jgi:hypothetical protein
LALVICVGLSEISLSRVALSTFTGGKPVFTLFWSALSTEAGEKQQKDNKR